MKQRGRSSLGGSHSTKRSRESSKEALTPNATKKGVSFLEGGNISPVMALVSKLEKEGGDLVKSRNDIELAGFDVKLMSETAEDILRRREEVKHLMGDPEYFDESGKTEVNYEYAAIAGAKLLIDETRATRSICKKLMDQCGVDENTFLYGGLKNGQRETKSVHELTEFRLSSVIESFVDLKKQLQFKKAVLDHVADKAAGTFRCAAKSDPCHSKPYRMKEVAKAKNRRPLAPRTPANRRNAQINPLDGKRIIDQFALEVASEVADRSKRRRIAGIPFNLHLLDDVEDD